MVVTTAEVSCGSGGCGAVVVLAAGVCEGGCGGGGGSCGRICGVDWGGGEEDAG